MATRLAPWTVKALEVLADGQWHDRDDVITAAARVVPPGRAFRVGEHERNRTKNRPGGPGPRVRGDDSDSIVLGARELARVCLRGLVRNGRAERDGDRVRLRVPGTVGPPE